MRQREYRQRITELRAELERVRDSMQRHLENEQMLLWREREATARMERELSATWARALAAEGSVSVLKVHLARAQANEQALRQRGAAPQDQRHRLAVGDAAPVVIAPGEGADDAHVVSSELRMQDFTGRARQGDDLDATHSKPK